MRLLGLQGRVELGAAWKPISCSGRKIGFARTALDRLCRAYVALGGYLFIGLYHKYGRQLFLDCASAASGSRVEEELLARYRELHSALTDQTHARSWFRDLVLHPQETQHTLREIAPVLSAAGMSIAPLALLWHISLLGCAGRGRQGGGFFQYVAGRCVCRTETPQCDIACQWRER
jgi:hypothetical protein